MLQDADVDERVGPAGAIIFITQPALLLACSNSKGLMMGVGWKHQTYHAAAAAST